MLQSVLVKLYEISLSCSNNHYREDDTPGMLTTFSISMSHIAWAEVKSHELYSPIEQAGCGIFRWIRHNNCTTKPANIAHKDIMPNASSNGLWSRTHKLHIQMRPRLILDEPDSITTIMIHYCQSWFSLHNSEIHSSFLNSTSKSRLSNYYGTGRSHNGLLIGGVTIYKWGMTILELISIPTPCNHRTRRAGRMYLR